MVISLFDFADAIGLEEQAVDSTLEEISSILKESGRRLTDFGLPEPKYRSTEVILEEDAFASRQLQLQTYAQRSIDRFSQQQMDMFTAVLGRS